MTSPEPTTMPVSQRYDLQASLAEDSGEDCIVLDIGNDEDGTPVTSLEHIEEKVTTLSWVSGLATSATKLYIVGEWHEERLAKQDSGFDEPELEDGMDNLRLSVDFSEHTGFKREATDEQSRKSRAIDSISTLIPEMPELKEVTWISDLPFSPVIMNVLPSTLTKLVVDLHGPVNVIKEAESHHHKIYLTATDMSPLLAMTKLEELRLFGMQDSLQHTIWQTAYKSELETGIKVLELNMAHKPIVRADKWIQANDVKGLGEIEEDTKDKAYKGIEGKGILHYAFGTGEYLDDFSMRKARIAAGIDENKPVPVTTLILDGFVVDKAPFAAELGQVSTLVLGPNCVDAGLQFPESGTLAEVCWPNWTGRA